MVAHDRLVGSRRIRGGNPKAARAVPVELKGTKVVAKRCVVIRGSVGCGVQRGPVVLADLVFSIIAKHLELVVCACNYEYGVGQDQVLNDVVCLAQNKDRCRWSTRVSDVAALPVAVRDGLDRIGKR